MKFFATVKTMNFTYLGNVDPFLSVFTAILGLFAILVLGLCYGFLNGQKSIDLPPSISIDKENRTLVFNDQARADVKAKRKGTVTKRLVKPSKFQTFLTRPLFAGFLPLEILAVGTVLTLLAAGGLFYMSGTAQHVKDQLVAQAEERYGLQLDTEKFPLEPILGDGATLLEDGTAGEFNRRNSWNVLAGGLGEGQPALVMGSAIGIDKDGEEVAVSLFWDGSGWSLVGASAVEPEELSLAFLPTQP